MRILDLPEECVFKLALYLDIGSLLELISLCKSLYTRLTSASGENVWNEKYYWIKRPTIPPALNYSLITKYRNLEVKLAKLGYNHMNGRSVELSQFMSDVQNSLQASEYIYLIKTIVAAINTLNEAAPPLFDPLRFPYFRGRHFEGLSVNKVTKLKGLLQHVLTEIKCFYSVYLYENLHDNPDVYNNPDQHLNILHYVGGLADNFLGSHAIIRDTINDLTDKIWSRLHDRRLISYTDSVQIPAALIDRQQVLASCGRLEVMDAVLGVMRDEGYLDNGDFHFKNEYNSYLHAVCKTMKGIPITRCALVASVAVNVGLYPSSVGLINHPSRVVLGLRINDKKGVDSFRYFDMFRDAIKALTYQQLSGAAYNTQTPAAATCTQFMTWREIGERSFANLRLIYFGRDSRGEDKYRKALLCAYFAYIMQFRSSSHWPATPQWTPPSKRIQTAQLDELINISKTGRFFATVHKALLIEYETLTGERHHSQLVPATISAPRGRHWANDDSDNNRSY